MSWAVLDWGIGGADLYRRLRATRPSVPMMYWSDSGFLPYGKVPRVVLVRRLAGVFGALAERGASHVVVACNAASAVLADLPLEARSGLAVTGVIDPALAALARGQRRHLGVIGGVRTIRSGVYGRVLRAQGHEVSQRVAQPLSALVEKGRLSGREVEMAVQRVVAPLGDVDGLVLACTHYPALAPVFRTCLPDVELIDPAIATLAWIKRHWRGEVTRGRSAVSPGAEAIFTTGKAKAMVYAAEAAFGVQFKRVREIRL